MVGQLIPRLELALTDIAGHKVVRVVRVQLHVNSQNSFRFHSQSADYAFVVTIFGVHMLNVRV